MSFSIIGEYCFKIPLTTMFLNEVVTIKNRNLITGIGEAFFLNRCINDLYKPIQHMCIGNGVNAPQKSDESLGNETKRNTCIQDVDLDNNRLLLISSFDGGDLIGASEIGVVTTNYQGTEILISHDVFDNSVLKESFLYGITGLIEVEYSFYFSTSHLKSGWTKYVNSNNVYWVFEPNDVVSVYDNTTSYGLMKVNNKEQVVFNKNSYFYDKDKTNNIYIHLHHDDDKNAPNPNKHDVLIQTR